MAKSPKKADAETVETVDAANEGGNTKVARARFAKALEEARAGAEALGKEARQRGEAVTGKLTEAVAAKRVDLIEEARTLTALPRWPTRAKAAPATR